MKMQFNLLNEFTQWIICEQGEDKTDRMLENPSEDGLDIRVYVNGVEIDINFDEIMRQMEASYVNEINKRANEIVYDKYGDLIKALQIAQYKFESDRGY